MSGQIQIYCLSCKKGTMTHNCSYKSTKNKRRYLSGNCNSCGRSKSVFVSSPTRNPSKRRSSRRRSSRRRSSSRRSPKPRYYSIPYGSFAPPSYGKVAYLTHV